MPVRWSGRSRTHARFKYCFFLNKNYIFPALRNQIFSPAQKNSPSSGRWFRAAVKAVILKTIQTGCCRLHLPVPFRSLRDDPRRFHRFQDSRFTELFIFFRFEPVAWTMAAFGACSTGVLVVDRLPSKLRHAGFALSDGALALMKTFEEGGEAVMALLALLAVLQSYLWYNCRNENN